MGVLWMILGLWLATLAYGQQLAPSWPSRLAAMRCEMRGAWSVSGGSPGSSGIGPRPGHHAILPSPGFGWKSSGSNSSPKSPPSSSGSEVEDLLLEGYLEGRVPRGKLLEWFRPEVEAKRKRKRMQAIVVLVAVGVSLLTTGAVLAWQSHALAVADEVEGVSLG